MNARPHGSHQLPKRERLQYSAEFRRAYDNGRRYEHRLAVLYVLERPGQSRAVGVVTSRKVGNAVVRNRVRRLLREAYRLNKQKLKPDLQFVFIARSAIAGKSYADVESAALQLLEAGGCLR